MAATEEFEGPPGEEKRIPLSTQGDVQRELAKVYRAMRSKRIDVAAGNGLTQTLFTLSKVMEVANESEALVRLERLEKARSDAAVQ